MGNQYNENYQSNNTFTDDGYLSDIHTRSTVRVGPFGVDPLNYTEFVIGCLSFWVIYLFIPRGLRYTFCGSYPKRYAWSARTKRRRKNNNMPLYHSQNGHHNMNSGSSIVSFNTAESSNTMNTNHRELSAQGIGTSDNNSVYSNRTGSGPRTHQHGIRPQSLPEEEVVDFTSPVPTSSLIHRNIHNPTPIHSSGGVGSTFNDDIQISATMQQLRDTGIQIIAHGSKGRPKKVRLVLTENAIEWRTESKRKNKVGKMHQVPLTHIMYVDVGKATTALRRVENSAIPENLCLSLLTKDGSLDLEANTAMERDALVNCFSLVLDEVHASWRDVYRAPSSDMPSELPSSFD